MNAPAIRLQGICKRFGAVVANADVDLNVAAGTVHGIVGENGAGKSTLMSVLYGLHAADSGSITLFGQAVRIRHTEDAIALGIGMVHQHFMLVDTLSALDNIMLGAEPHFWLPRAARAVREALTDWMQRTGLHLDLDRRVADLGVGARQRLEILKALYRGARILILDEPTAVLTPQEAEQLFAVLRALCRQGTTVLLITHKLKEVMAVCDQVSVMRAGRMVQSLPTRHASIAALAHSMVGRAVHVGRVPGPARTPGASLLALRGISLQDSQGVMRLQDIDLCLRAGEIVGVAGVAGNGQSELLEVLAGLVAPQRGSLHLGAQVFSGRRCLEPRTARQYGLAHVPEDRQACALVMAFAAWESAVLGYEGRAPYSSGVWLAHGAMRQATREQMQRLDVRPPDVDLPSGKFSGGNQQKLVLAREIGQAPKILLVGQPTRGVDIGAIELIYTQLRALRDAGCAVLVVSSELDEILDLADRVVVMHQGRIAAELPIAACTETGLGLLMAGASV